MRLCLREEMMSVEEAGGLTKEEVVMCARAREEIRKRVCVAGSGQRRSVRGNGAVVPSRTAMSEVDDRWGLNGR